MSQYNLTGRLQGVIAMQIYTVTFCTMDQDLGSNPLWHTCILLSRFDEASNKLEVVDNWGFYGLPTTDTNSVFRGAKIALGLDVDLTGNHGMLRHEDIRSLDAGCGLHGSTFELVAEKFNALQAKCKQMVAEQEQAINDIVKPLNLHGKTENQTRIYPFEHLSQHIYALEKEKAKEEHRPARLQRFALSFTEPRTCKMQVLELLDGILSAVQIKRLTGQSKRTSRLSGPMEKIFLHSSGPTRQHTKKSGEVVYFRDGRDEGVKLHWTFPPQEMETISGETRRFFKIPDEHCHAIKKVVSKLQRLEWLFMNTTFENEKCLPYRDEMLLLLKDYYEGFAHIEAKKYRPLSNNWSNSFLQLLSQPRDEDEKILMEKLESATCFLNTIYAAVVDNWDTKGEENDLEDDLEILAAYLPMEKKKQLCSILARSYLEPENQVSLSSSP